MNDLQYDSESQNNDCGSILVENCRKPMPLRSHYYLTVAITWLVKMEMPNCTNSADTILWIGSFD